MILQRSPERGLCLVTSFAMALDIPVATLLNEIGDGWKAVAFPGLPVPYCWRGVHVQELIRVALRRHQSVTPIELFPQVGPPMARHPNIRTPYPDVIVFYGKTEDDNWPFFSETILNCRGVLTGELASLPSVPLQRGHAVAFEKGVIFDPDAGAYAYSVQACEVHNFFPNCAYRIDQMESPNVQSIQPDFEVYHANIDY